MNLSRALWIVCASVDLRAFVGGFDTVFTPYIWLNVIIASEGFDLFKEMCALHIQIKKMVALLHILRFAVFSAVHSQ